MFHEDVIVSKVKPIHISHARRKEKDSSITENERTALRSSAMTTMWVAREARQDMLGHSSISARKVENGTVQDLLDQNKLVAHALNTKDQSDGGAMLKY